MSDDEGQPTPTSNPDVDSENPSGNINERAAMFEEPKSSGGSATLTSSSPSSSATPKAFNSSPALSHSASSPSGPGGVDSSKLDVEKAKATMKLMGARPHPGGVKGLGGGDNYTPGGGTVNTKSTLPHVAPGQHPWIAMGRQGGSTATTKKKIILPPEGAWGDGHPGGVKKFI